MMTLIRQKINGFIDIATADDDENPDAQPFHQDLYQNLTKFDLQSNFNDKKNLM